MKAIKTIVATAVIVFALTTVAMAGVQRFSESSGDGTQAVAGAPPAAQPAVAQSAGGVTLSARQFATLLRAVGHDATPNSNGSHTRDRDRTHKHQTQQSHAHAQDAGTSGVVATASHHAATHHTTTRHTTTPHTTLTHHSATYLAANHGTHDGGHHDGGHDGGCD